MDHHYHATRKKHCFKNLLIYFNTRTNMHYKNSSNVLVKINQDLIRKNIQGKTAIFGLIKHIPMGWSFEKKKSVHQQIHTHKNTLVMLTEIPFGKNGTTPFSQLQQNFKLQNLHFTSSPLTHSKYIYNTLSMHSPSG